MSFQGVEFTPEMRKMVVNAKQFFDSLKKSTEGLKKPSTQLAASALNISESTVKVTMAAFNKKGDEGLHWSDFQQRGRPTYAIESSIEPSVRQFIRKANQNGKQVNIEILRQLLKDRYHQSVAHTTLWRSLQRWGFEFGLGIRSAQLKESERVIILRRQYLRAKRANRDSGGKAIRSEIYLDESYINKNHSRDNTWYSEEDGIIIGKPTGKGERLIIINAISEDGWVPNAKLVFKAAKKTGDYHSNMNRNNFTKWFKENLLKNIPANSLIIMDNAAYHNVLMEETFPKKSHSVRRLREWLTNNEIPWNKDMLKMELYKLCERLATKPEFLIDKIANEHGHSVLRTPPYHPELQPIETCWAVVKNFVAQNSELTMKSVWSSLEKGFETVTAETCQKIIAKTIRQEEAFWDEDGENLSIN